MTSLIGPLRTQNESIKTEVLKILFFDCLSKARRISNGKVYIVGTTTTAPPELYIILQELFIEFYNFRT